MVFSSFNLYVRRKRLMRFDGFIAEPDMPIPGMGIYTYYPLVPDGDKFIKYNEDSFNPVLTSEYGGVYTGKKVSNLEAMH